MAPDAAPVGERPPARHGGSGPGLQAAVPCLGFPGSGAACQYVDFRVPLGPPRPELVWFPRPPAFWAGGVAPLDEPSRPGHAEGQGLVTGDRACTERGAEEGGRGAGGLPPEVREAGRVAELRNRTNRVRKYTQDPRSRWRPAGASAREGPRGRQVEGWRLAGLPGASCTAPPPAPSTTPVGPPAQQTTGARCAAPSPHQETQGYQKGP